MSFKLVYDPEVEDTLADIWLKASDRQAVTSPSDQIDAALPVDPFKDSEDRGAYRCKKVPPLLVLYEVSEKDRAVHVFHVQRYP